MKQLRLIRPAVVALLVCLSITGCGGKTSTFEGRWYNKDISIRFRTNGSVLYNSRHTGLVQGQYRYDAKPASLAVSQPVKNLTIWLPQPGEVRVMEFEIRTLGGHRVQLKPIPRTPRSANDPINGLILKRAQDDSGSNALEESRPLVSASREK